MKLSKSKLTVLTNLTLAIIGLLIAHLTNLIILVPVLFALGTPLINLDIALKQKIALTSVIILVTLIIFIITIWAAVSFNVDKYLLPGLLVGIAGVLTLGINGLLIETIRINAKTLGITFLLSGLSLPIWIFLTENVLPKVVSDINVLRQNGAMMFWMMLTTIGIGAAIKDKKSTANLAITQ